MQITLAVVAALVAAACFYISPSVRTADSFFKGRSETGGAPSVLALTFSQVTTWIFARSIMNAAILGYFYGIAGALAYTAYYLSFLTGAHIISSLRFRHGFDSVQSFLYARFGIAGTTSYNFVVAIRLVSEVFANLLVIGLLFGKAGTDAYTASIVIVGVVTLGYALMGGQHASIRTDVAQMGLFLAVLLALVAVVLSIGTVDIAAITASSPDGSGPGWVLLAVALLQVWSYPMHDPVMMDRGFIADRKTTMASFYNAAWIGVLCIMAFGLIGVWAGLNKLPGETFVPALTRLIGDNAMLLFNIALVVSSMSTLDSAFASASKLVVVDMKVAKPTVANGRIAMAGFLVAGLAMISLGSKDLFGAVAVSGTASMFLAPVVFFSLWLGRDDVPVWSYVFAFAVSLAAAVFYFAESSGYMNLIGDVFGVQHKYSKLLILSAIAMLAGCGAFALGILTGKSRPGALAAN